MGAFDNIAAFQQLKVSNTNVERYTQGLYDTLLYPTAGQTALNFYSTPIGAGLSSQQGNAGNPKTINDTNMTLAGQLPKGQQYIIESIECEFDAGSVSTANTYTPAILVAFAAAAAATVTAGINDYNAVLQSGLLTLTIIQKNYLQEGPISRFPPKTHKTMNVAVANNSSTTAEVISGNMYADGRPYYLAVPLPIEESQNFGLTLTWPVAVATPTGFNGRIKVTFDGQMYRVSQ